MGAILTCWYRKSGAASLVLLMLSVLHLSACSVAPPKQVKIAPPAAPTLPKADDPIPFPITGAVPEPRPIDEVGEILSAAEKHFEQGDQFNRTGFLKKAKDEFDSALDLLLDAPTEY